MIASAPESDPTPHGQAFLATNWSLVWRARQGDTVAAEACEKLCLTYWPPLYAYIRREGYSVEDAQDLTQEFLSRLMHKEWLNHLQDQRGKFRSFLLTFLKNFLSDQRDHDRAQKRGGGLTLVSIDAYEAEEREFAVPADTLTPEQIFERRWALAVMTQAVERLRQDYATRGQTALFEQFKDLQPGEHGESSYAQIGAALGMTEQAVKNAAHTFRRRYAQLLRGEIAQTVMEPDEVHEELQHLMTVFAR